MRSKVLAPHRRAWIGARTLAVCAAAATMAGVGSCGSSGTSSVIVTGSTLSVYLSAPTPGAPQQVQDVLDAEQLARRGTSTIGKFAIRFIALNEPKLSDQARTAIEDQSTVAYLGELLPGDSSQSVGITNGADVLQVSPTDTALELTQATPAVPGAPGEYYEARSTYGQTFARVVPNSAQEAKAQVQEMQALGVKSLYVTNDGSDYGAAIALAVRSDAAAASIHAMQGPPSASSFKSSGADALFDGASAGAANNAATLLATVAQQNGAVRLFAPSALDSTTFASRFGPASLHLYVSSPGFLSKDLTPAGKQFEAAFTAAYGHQPAPEAIFGYEAMKAVLYAIQTAGSSASDRSKVVQDFFSIKNRSSALGTYSINSSGDTTLAPFVFNRLQARTLVPFVSVTPQG